MRSTSTTMTNKLAIFQVILALVIVANLINVQANDNNNQETTITRRSLLIRRHASASASATSGSTSASSSTKPALTSGGSVGGESTFTEGRPISRRPPAANGRRPLAGSKQEEPTQDDDFDGDDSARLAPSRSASAPRRRVKSKQRYNYGDNDEEDENCYDEDEAGANFDGEEFTNNMFHRPMNQFSRIMGNMFDQMQSMSRGNFANQGGLRDGLGVAASASSSTNDDGYSRTSSLINNNGRTRGLVSETRNGRTQTRRIGNWNDNNNNAGDEE